MMVINQVDECLQFGYVTMDVVKSCILVIVSFPGAIRQPLLYIRRDEERRPIAKMPVKLRQEDVDTGQIKVTKMHIAVGDLR